MKESFGRPLEKARHALGKSLAEAEDETKIRAKRLEALEQGDLESLPSPAYVKGYITAYAKFLLLDPKPLLEAYEREIEGSEQQPVRLPDQVVVPRSQTHHVPARTAAAVFTVIVLLAAAVWGVTRVISGPEEPPPIPVIPEPTSTAEPAVPSTTGPGVSDDDAAAPDDDEPDTPARPAAPFTVRVEVASDSASWLRVSIDDLTAYEGTMAGGQSQEWTAEESAILRIGRAPAVTVYQDGIEVEIPPGDPPVLELPIE